jgi:hypothetical protein
MILLSKVDDILEDQNIFSIYIVLLHHCGHEFQVKLWDMLK